MIDKISNIIEYKNYDLASSTASIILQAKQELISPSKFYRLCQQVRQLQGHKKLYFLEPAANILDLKQGIGINQLRHFFDYLAQYVRDNNIVGHQEEFYLQKDNVAEKTIKFNQSEAGKGGIKILVEIIGEGMVGRVARVRINHRDLAF